MAERSEPVRIGIRAFRERLSDYLRQAGSGARFLIVSRGQPVAELGAPTDPATRGIRSPRKLGTLRGKIWLSDDWDEWPEGFVEQMISAPIEPES